MQPRQATVPQVVAMLLLLVALGCGASGSSEYATAWPLAVGVTRASDLPVNSFPPFTATISDAKSVQLLWDAIEDLPQLQTPVFCPLDSGLSYRLTFAGSGNRVQHITARASGCREVILGASDRRATDARFWSELANSAGLSVADLFLPPPSHA